MCINSPSSIAKGVRGAHHTSGLRLLVDWSCTSRNSTRKSKYEDQQQYEQRLIEWEASQPVEMDIRPKGNSMNQTYYTEHILPIYINATQSIKRAYGNAILQEDKDSSHGTRSAIYLPQSLREHEGIQSLFHPAQSPDLNPIEALLGHVKAES